MKKIIGIMFTVVMVLLLLSGCGIPQEAHDAVVAERDAAKSQVASLQSDLAEAESHVETAESDLAAAEGDLTTAQSQISSSKSDLTTAQSQISSLQTAVSTAETALAEAEAQAAELEEVITTQEGSQVGDLSPGFQLQDLDGETVSLSDLRGSPVILNFWATWCEPCRREMPYLQQIYEEWQDKGLVILTINTRQDVSNVREFMQRNNLSFPVLLDTNGDVAQKYDITGIPTTFFIKKYGIIQERKIGSAPSKQHIEYCLSKIMPKLVAKELKYDDGEAKDFISVFPPFITGYLVDFTPPATPFTIKKVRLYGQLATGWVQENFEVEIWDKDHNVLYSAAFAVTLFTEWPEANWVEVQIPDIEVVGEFYVHVHTGTGIGEGIHMGADDSVVNEHSNVTVQTEEGISTMLAYWLYSPDYWFGDKSNVNWMIRVVGTPMEREQS